LIDKIIEAIPGMKVARSARTPAGAGEAYTKDIGGNCKKKH